MIFLVKKTVEDKVLKYGDIDIILKDIFAMPEVSREEKEVKNKNEVIKAIEKGILSMLKKGYSIKATTDFFNKRLSPYSITETEVKKLLRKVTEKKKTSSKKKEKDSVLGEGDFTNDATTSPVLENNTEDKTKVQMPNFVPEEE